jgi:hypothetical protein
MMTGAVEHEKMIEPEMDRGITEPEERVSQSGKRDQKFL